jgi:hypothetical protein
LPRCEGVPMAPTGLSMALLVSGGNAQSGKLHWCWLDSMAGEQMVSAIGGLQKHTELATGVWDGAPGHRDEWVRELGMPLTGLPPYTPELNPPDRISEEVRREIE